MKNIIITILSLLSIITTTTAHEINYSVVATGNDTLDNVADIVTDANGNSYVLQNTFHYTTSSDIAGMSSVIYYPGAEHALMSITKIDVSGNVSLFGWIDINSTGSDVTGTALYINPNNGRLYACGYFAGDISLPLGANPNGLAANRTSNAYDMFVCRFDAIGNIDAFDQEGGDGNEYATCMMHYGTEVYVGGNYGVSSNAPFYQYTTFSDGTTAPALDNISQTNIFIAKFDQGLTLQQVGGFCDLANTSSKIEIRGIAVAGTTIRNTYFTGAFKGTVNFNTSSGTSTIVNTANDVIMVTGRYINPSDYYHWMVTEGLANARPAAAGGYFHSAGNAIQYTTGGLYVGGTINYNTGTANFSGAQDAVLIKYTSIASNPPTKTFEVKSGGGWEDEIKDITYDNTNIYVSGNFIAGSGTFTFRSNSIAAVTYTSSKNQIFLASYNASGNLIWKKTAESNGGSNATAISSNGKCNITFGGIFRPTLDFKHGSILGSSSPSKHHLFAARIPTRDLTFTPAIPTDTLVLCNFGSAGPYTVGNATTYFRVIFPDVSFSGIAPTLSSSTGANFTVNSAGTNSGFVSLYNAGYYSQGGQACTTVVRQAINLALCKTDGSETGIEDDGQGENISTTFRLYPNPIHNLLNIDISGMNATMEYTLEVVDLLGRQVHQSAIHTNTSSISSLDWAKGIYFARIMENGTIIHSKKVLKQ